MKNLYRAFAEICKTEDQPDGTIKVFGYASTSTLDSQKERVTADAMKAAIPDYMKWGAVREMHDTKKAAGTAIEARVEDDGRTFFGAHVVDSEAVKKVKTGVYKGFSIGGKKLKTTTEKVDGLPVTDITELNLTEVSLVDRPANPECVITMWKSEDAAGEESVDALADLLNKGTISPAKLVELARAEIKKNEEATTEAPKVEEPKAEEAKKEEPKAEEKPAVEATTASPAAVAEPVTTDKNDKPKADAQEIKKGMYTVAQLALLLDQLDGIRNCTAWEAKDEGDNSAVPERLRKCINQLSDVLREMVVEEAAELTATKAQGAGDILKSKTAVEDENDLQKMQKVVTDLTSQITKLQGEIDTLKAQPAPAKGALKAIAKGDDVVEEPATTTINKSATPEEQARDMIKKQHQSGGQIVNFR